MRNVYILTVLLIVFFWGRSSAQLVSGIINAYTAVTAVNYCANEIIVQNAAAFNPGDLALIIQMQGATAEVNTTNIDTFGIVRNFTDYNGAGNCEFLTIIGKNANTLTIQQRLNNTYIPAGRVQLVRVPRYGSVTVNGVLTAPAWNGVTGGVLVLDVTGTLLLGADIDMSGRGFRGGAPSLKVNPAPPCSITGATYAVNDGFAGNKGEGIATILNEAGRGALANGGGGGNGRGASGAGGSNSAYGGKGGTQTDSCGTGDYGGRGGHPLLYSVGTSKLYLGGGGGGGHSRITTGGTGGAGGGIIIIRANSIDGNGIIRANGAAGVAANRDGAGGGGAGGTIVLEIQNYLSPLTVTARGGAGGNATLTPAFGCHGPGGGGSGGTVAISTTLLPTALTLDIRGGARGAYTANFNCNPIDFEAEDGRLGKWLGGFRVAQSNNNFEPIAAGAKVFEACLTSGVGKITVLPRGGFPPYSYRVNNGVYQGNPDILNLPPGTYLVQVQDFYGCVADTLVQIIPSTFKIDIGLPNYIVCGPLTLSSDRPAEKYLWSTGDTTPSLTVDTSAVYRLIATDENGCTAEDSADVWRFRVVLGPDTSACGELLLDAGPNGLSYNWSNGDFYQKIKVRKTANYSVKVRAPSGCFVTDDINVVIHPNAQLDFPNEFKYCPITEKFKQIIAPPGYQTYMWLPDTVLSDTVRLDTTGIYTLAIKDWNNCPAKQEFRLKPFCGLELQIPTAFSPNNDGDNDEFYVVGDSIEYFSIRVYARLGQEVYRSEDHLERWNGKAHNTGGNLPEGVYFWTIGYRRKGMAANEYSHGSVTIIR